MYIKLKILNTITANVYVPQMVPKRQLIPQLQGFDIKITKGILRGQET